ncbi:MAG: long-chain-fatty-acid--CoA ligase [SAR324 cluster bacterium]|nr:long-chain-fatty-acid--CoA ligase [SAR324 cluster bacterium]
MTDACNYFPLTPQSFIRRSARVYPDKTAVIYGNRRYPYQEFFQRVCRQANALISMGVGQDVTVCSLMPNIPPQLESAYGVHMAGGILVALNYRLSPREIGYILNHCKARVLMVDYEFLPVIKEIAGELEHVRHFVVVQDGQSEPEWQPEGAVEYETMLASASIEDPAIFPRDENDTISINYTSGTTGLPKGVVYTHRGAYLNATCNLLEMTMSADSIYLWTLPMFHCNGWCFSWAAPGMGAASICMRQVEGRLMRDLIRDEGVTLFCGAPVVLQMLAALAEEEPFQFERPVKAGTGGAPPSPTLLAAMREINVEVSHLYGLTETYGPSTICEVQDHWLKLPAQEFAGQLARQGVGHHLIAELAVMDAEHNRLPADAETMGEVCIRGNTVMLGYYRDEAATAEAFREGWFHTGDLGVMHPDGYIEIRDRAKDIIISGGENISTIEVENMLAGHPDIAEAAVVSRPDDKWGEVPVAFVNLKPGKILSEREVIEFCRERMAHFKCPKAVIFEALPRTSTGKVQKFALRERMWAGQQKRIKG